ncbi:MAG: polyprenyl synthetase family protein [Dissulfurimicrobium sp.]|uniref:polyprenyl synthetase family protein n=1 Tax=Dissulfurimicrobium sp. TaxID=2022436 RepID=UPI00404B1589
MKIDILEQLKPYFERLDRHISSHFASHIPFINEISGHILFAGGKRIRPLLTVFAAKLCGEDTEDTNEAYDLALVPEYLHAASLLHDDVVDGGKLRRGKPPAYTIWGNKAAVLAGDFLYARAIELATRFNDVRIARATAETVALMSEGEILQLLHSKDPGFDEKTYMEVIYRKTAALISMSCRIGAIFARADDARVKALVDYGLCLGQAFQMIDDLLDYTADSKEFGKTIGADLAEGKLTLPLVHGFSAANSKEKKRLLSILKNEEHSTEEFIWVKELLEATGAFAYTKKKAESLIKIGCKGLDIFGPSETADILKRLAIFVIERKK